MAIVGEQFQKYVSDQINKRQEIHGKENRSIEDLQYLNSKTAWVKLASGVSLKGDERIKDLGWNRISDGMDLAKKYVLFGGVSKKNDTTVLEQFGGINLESSYQPYNINAKQQTTHLDFGFVPPPGIESAEIKNMNRGSIKKATVKIKAYSRDQFDILDILYMRLGYTVLLEWGWSHYFNNSGKLETMFHTLIEDKYGFFSDNAKSHRQFLPKIERYRNRKDGNYDGLLAKVSNFSWTFNPDGSYDITLTLISLGDVIESLKTNVSPRLNDVDFTEEDKPKDVLSEYLYIWKKTNTNSSESVVKSTIYTYDGGEEIGYIIDADKYNTQILRERQVKSLNEFGQTTIRVFQNEEEATQVMELRKKELKEEGKEIVNSTIKRTPGTARFFFEITHKTDPTTNTGTSAVIYFNYESTEEENTIENNINYYITFEHLLEKVKELCLPINNEEKIIDLETRDMKMLYYPNQISCDPRICVVKGEINGTILFPQLKKWGDENTGTAQTKNIYVNFSTIQNAIDSNLDENNKLSLISFLQSICNDLNRALGGINNLEPIVDEDNNIINIIDGSLISDNAYKKPYGLEIFGYNPAFKSSNFVRNLNLQTQITPEYATMVTIGATAGGYVKGTEATMFSKWNKGIIDRFKEEYLPPTTTPETKETDIKEPETNYIKYLQSGEKILGLDGNEGFKLNDTVIDSNLSVVEEYYKYLNYIAQQEQDTFASSTNGFIPFNLGITMDGISGIKIYNKLNVATRFLPQNYPDSLHFIIKGVSHKISNQDWETTLETQVVPKSVIDSTKPITRSQPTFTAAGAATGAAAGAGTGSRERNLKTFYPELPFSDIPPAPNLLSYKNAAIKLKNSTDLSTAKAVFAIMWAEASKDNTLKSFKSAGGYNYAGVQTDVGRWGAGGIIGRYRRIDSGNVNREFAIFSDDDAFLKFMINRIKAKGFNGSDADSWTTTYINSWWSPAAKSQYTKGTEKYNQKKAIYNTAINKFNQYVK